MLALFNKLLEALIFFKKHKFSYLAKIFGSSLKYRVLHHITKYASRPSPSTKLGKMPIRVAGLAFDLCVLYYRSPCTQTFPTTENKSKEGDFQSILSLDLALRVLGTVFCLKAFKSFVIGENIFLNLCCIASFATSFIRKNYAEAVEGTNICSL
jgi:hypothetical protein